MSRSVFCCRACKTLLGLVDGDRLLVEPQVVVRNYLKRGEAVLTCPKCRITRIFHGGIVEMNREG